MTESLTTRVLIDIRDGVRAIGARLDETNARLDQTNERLDQTNERLSILARITQGIDGRLTRMEPQGAFLPRRVEALEVRVGKLARARAKKPRRPAQRRAP